MQLTDLLVFIVLYSRVLYTVVSAEHTKLGLETRRRCRMFGRVEAWVHCAELPRTRLLDPDGKSVRDEILQSGEYLLRFVSSTCSSHSHQFDRIAVEFTSSLNLPSISSYYEIIIRFVRVKLSKI